MSGVSGVATANSLDNCDIRYNRVFGSVHDILRKKTHRENNSTLTEKIQKLPKRERVKVYYNCNRVICIAPLLKTEGASQNCHQSVFRCPQVLRPSNDASVEKTGNGVNRR